MSPFVEAALQAIESVSPEVVGEGFLQLAEVIAVNRIGNFQSDIIPEANDEILEWGPLEKIQRAIQDWIERHPDHMHVTSAFWALDKFHDRDLRPFLRKHLEYCIERALPHLHPLGQILITLNNLNEQCISQDSFGAHEFGKNLDDAVAYLKKTHPERPWHAHC